MVTKNPFYILSKWNKVAITRLNDNIRAVDIEQIMKKIFLFRIS